MWGNEEEARLAEKKNPKPQIPKPKSKKFWVDEIWDLGFGIWDLGFTLKRSARLP
jgi:hypothetical protein